LDEAQHIAHVGYWDRDLVTGQMTLSDEACRIFGFPPDERILDLPRWHKRWLALIHPSDRTRLAEAVETALRGGPRYDVEYRVTRPDGTVRIIHSRGEVTWGDNGRPTRMFGMMQDITSLREAERALRASEARFRTIVEHAADGLFVIDRHLRVIDVNRSACDSLGRTREELIGMHVRDFDAGLDEATINQLAASLNGGETLTFETQHRRKDGTVFPVEIRSVQFEQGGLGSLSLVRDITERKRAERALTESHALLSAVVEGTSDPIFIKDLQGRYLMINSAGARSLGRAPAEMIGKHDRELFPPDITALVTERDGEVLATERTLTFQETRDGSEMLRHYLTTKGVYRDQNGNVRGLFGISRDVTELKRLEDELKQSQKLEAVGKLAGGIAHDFNNLLTIINSCADLALLEVDAERGRELLAEIHQAGDRAATLTRQLLAFSRRQVLHAQVVDLNKTIEQVGNLLRRVIGEDVELSFRFDHELGPVKIDAGQFEQAILNLAVNARDAMPEGGRLRIETSNVELDDDLLARHSDLHAGRYAQVTVSDSGQGIPPSTMAHIFEPFFTTKPVGKGTGLGLAMVYGFLKQSGGHVDVHSEPGLGTTFQLYLPVAVGLAADVPRRSELPRHSKGSETVLLVEDEDTVRRLCQRVLSSAGFTVVEARNGEEALEMAKGLTGKLHILVSDLVMPRMGGRQVASLLRNLWPELCVLFVSGYTDDGSPQHDYDPRVDFLQKPFGPPALVNKVRELLDAEGPARRDVVPGSRDIAS
jgi:PAS domain S-box-containing protein